MRVLHINVNYLSSALHQTMIEHLDEFDIVNQVFVPTYDKSLSRVDCNENVVVSECFNKWDRVTYHRKQKKIINTVEKQFDISKYDIIHAYTVFTDGNVAMELSKKYNIPYVVAVRNTDVNAFFKKMIHLRTHGVKILENASAVFFLSPVYRELVLNNYVPSKIKEAILEKSYIIPNGIDDYWHENLYERNCAEIAERINNNRIIKCLYAGIIDKNKNVEMTCKALSDLNSNGWNCTLTVVGRIADRALFKSLCEYPFFEYVEPKRKEELINYYRDADIFVMPSYTESFGLVYAEAMTQGLPVIYSKGQGFDMQFPEGTVGFHVDPRSKNSIADSVNMTVNMYDSLSKNSIAKVAKFKWNQIAQIYDQIYKQIIM